MLPGLPGIKSKQYDHLDRICRRDSRCICRRTNLFRQSAAQPLGRSRRRIRIATRRSYATVPTSLARTKRKALCQAGPYRRCTSIWFIIQGHHHAVAVDAFYDTSAEVIRNAYEQSFEAIADAGCRTVAAACLACGYGRVDPRTFVTAVKPFLAGSLREIDCVEFISTDSELIAMIQREISDPTSA
jgi:hypothetical protein